MEGKRSGGWEKRNKRRNGESRVVSNCRTTVYSDTQMRRENCVNVRRYHRTVGELCGIWCTKNGARLLFPVGARSD